MQGDEEMSDQDVIAAELAEALDRWWDDGGAPTQPTEIDSMLAGLREARRRGTPVEIATARGEAKLGPSYQPARIKNLRLELEAIKASYFGGHLANANALAEGRREHPQPDRGEVYRKALGAVIEYRSSHVIPTSGIGSNELEVVRADMAGGQLSLPGHLVVLLQDALAYVGQSLKAVETGYLGLTLYPAQRAVGREWQGEGRMVPIGHPRLWTALLALVNARGNYCNTEQLKQAWVAAGLDEPSANSIDRAMSTLRRELLDLHIAVPNQKKGGFKLVDSGDAGAKRG
jgi:hypothetical protein